MALNIFLKYILILLTVLSAGSCCKINESPNSVQGVELYLLEAFEMTDQHYFQIDESSVTTKNSPLLEYEELIIYNAGNYTFKISETAKTKIRDLKHPVHGLAFAVKVDNESIYTGYFWPSYSSMSCDWVVIDPYIGDDNEMQVRLGYPGPTQGIIIPDNRNDPRLLEVFRKDGKLLE
jgi:hypothetical protein